MNYTLRGTVFSNAHSLEDKNMKNKETGQVSNDLLLRRLKRIEGQIRGIQKMIAEDRDCVSIVTQLAAVRSGVEGVGALVLNNCMKICLINGPDIFAQGRIPSCRPPCAAAAPFPLG